jgi:dTMP kinase
MKRFETYGTGIPGLDLAELTGWLIVIEGTDGVGRTTHVNHLRQQLERLGYAVAETGLSRSDLASQGIRRAKQGNTLGSTSTTRPTSRTASSTRSFRRCAPVS